MAALAGLLALVALSPTVQTWVAQMILARQTDWHASLGSLSAGFGKIDLTDLHLEIDGAVLTLPSLSAQLPVTRAVWNRKVMIQSLVAKGWTLDLSPTSATPSDQSPEVPRSGGEPSPRAPAAAPASALAPPKARRPFHGLLSEWHLPFDGAFDGVELDGTVLAPVEAGKAPARLHVTIKGGGLSADHEGSFSVDTAATYLDSQFQVGDISTRGRLTLAMATPRTLNRAELKTDLSGRGGSFPAALVLTADMTAARLPGEELYTLDLSRGTQKVANLLTHFPAATHQLVSHWKIDLHESDLAALTAGHLLPPLTATGEGDLELDPGFGRIHALGQLNFAARHLGVLAPALGAVADVKLVTQFDLARNGPSSRIQRLSATLAGDRPAVSVHLLQPFTFDENSGQLTASDPSGDLIEGTVAALPVAWLAGLAEEVSLSGGDLAGDFAVRAAQGVFSLRMKTPLIATGVSLQRAGHPVASGLDLSLALLGESTAKGWKLDGSPLTITSSGQRLGSVEFKASQLAGENHPVALTGTWNADFEALKTRAAVEGLGWITARSASGDFSATVGAGTTVEGNVAIVGTDATETITANPHASFGGGRAITFRVPMKITSKTETSELSVDGTWAGGQTGNRINLRLGGKNVALQQLRALAGPTAMITGTPLVSAPASQAGPSSTTGNARDRMPFWGNCVGSISVSFDRLRTEEHDLSDVRATFELDHKSMQMENGLYTLSDSGLGKVNGTLSFDPAATVPYKVNATFAGGEIDAAPLFGKAPAGQDAPFKGRFSIENTVTGSGNNLADLIERAQEEFQLTSKNGIVRLLKVSVSDALPHEATPVSDAAGTVGNLVGSLFGFQKNSVDSGQIHLAKNTEAVLGFTYQVAEIGYQEITLKAIRGSDHSIRIVDFSMTAADEHITGNGQINYVKGVALAAQPLSADLHFGVRGDAAQFLANTGLLSPEKDSLGYTRFTQPVHFGGTLQKLDETEWHDLLARAAAPKPDAEKKSGHADAAKK